MSIKTVAIALIVFTIVWIAVQVYLVVRKVRVSAPEERGRTCAYCRSPIDGVPIVSYRTVAYRSQWIERICLACAEKLARRGERLFVMEHVIAGAVLVLVAAILTLQGQIHGAMNFVIRFLLSGGLGALVLWFIAWRGWALHKRSPTRVVPGVWRQRLNAPSLGYALAFNVLGSGLLIFLTLVSSNPDAPWSDAIPFAVVCLIAITFWAMNWRMWSSYVRSPNHVLEVTQAASDTVRL